MRLVTGLATFLVVLIYSFLAISYGTVWVFLSCTNAPSLARVLAQLSGVITIGLILVWLSDTLWACVDGPPIADGAGRHMLPGAFPLQRGPVPMKGHESQWLCSLFLQAVTWVLLILWMGAENCPF